MLYTRGSAAFLVHMSWTSVANIFTATLLTFSLTGFGKFKNKLSDAGRVQASEGVEAELGNLRRQLGLALALVSSPTLVASRLETRAENAHYRQNYDRIAARPLRQSIASSKSLICRQGIPEMKWKTGIFSV